MKSIFLFLLTVFFAVTGVGQTVEDSLGTKKLPDTPKTPARARISRPVQPAPRKDVDTVPKRIMSTRQKKLHRPGYNEIVKQNPYFNFYGKAINQTIVDRTSSRKDGLFYTFVAIVLYFALVRLLFFRYLDNLFVLFFRASLKQKQIREQLLQAPLPSLLMNILFVVVGGIYIGFLLQYYKFAPNTSLLLLSLYATGALAIMYFCKFVVLKALGWIFNIEEATDMYIFIVFLVNKMLAIFLLPLLVLMAFSGPGSMRFLITLSYIVIIIAFAYRYIISFAPVRKQINVSQFHFFLYLCGFEIIPLLVIYKVLLSFFERSF